MTTGAMFVRVALAFWLSFPPGSPATAPWDKSPERWDLAETFRVLRDSPWVPSEIKLEVTYTQRHTDPQTGLVSGSPVNPQNTPSVRGAELSRNKPLPPVSVLWWSSRTIRLAEQRLHQLRNSGVAAPPLRAEELPDYVIVIEGSEPLRILRDAREDLHDTIFLELPDGFALDLANVRFLEETGDDEVRVEFHFPRQIDGHHAIDPDVERVIFHCKATAKTPRQGRENTLSFRAEFHPRAMRARGLPDL